MTSETQFIVMSEPVSGFSLTGQLLVAMPQMRDPRFTRSVIYMCAHNAEGAMGLVINRLVGSITFPDMLEQLGITAGEHGRQIKVHFGGPVDAGRGFVLHSDEYRHEGTVAVVDGMALTATIDILKDIAGGQGPRRCLLALGYAGWGAGQLDAEIQANGWLTVPADADLVFEGDLDGKWERALGKIGVSRTQLSGETGHA
jgi:putative transcriptional regulator